MKWRSLKVILCHNIFLSVGVGEFIGYMFLIAESEKSSKVFPWWAVDNSDELPLATDIRLLQFGIELCEKSECFQLAERLQHQLECHKKYIGRRTEEMSR